VRHRLAEAYTELTSTAGIYELAASVPSEWSATLAKMQAGRLQQRVATHALQVCGAIGVSNEFSLHRYVARTGVLDALTQPGLPLSRDHVLSGLAGRPRVRLTGWR
jgi:alkylation response protein AidB-like acyl-CoA dehydrogenase